jgi:hypothetical protein
VQVECRREEFEPVLPEGPLREAEAHPAGPRETLPLEELELQLIRGTLRREKLSLALNQEGGRLGDSLNQARARLEDFQLALNQGERRLEFLPMRPVHSEVRVRAHKQRAQG